MPSTVLRSEFANYEFSLPASLVVVERNDEGDFSAVDRSEGSNYGAFRDKLDLEYVPGGDPGALFDNKVQRLQFVGISVEVRNDAPWLTAFLTERARSIEAHASGGVIRGFFTSRHWNKGALLLTMRALYEPGRWEKLMNEVVSSWSSLSELKQRTRGPFWKRNV